MPNEYRFDMNKFVATMRLVRIHNVLFVALFQILLRYCVVLPLLAAYGVEPSLTSFQFVLLVVTTTTLAASGNVINDYFDIAADQINRPERQVVGSVIERRGALLLHVLLTLVGLFCGLALAVFFHKETYALLFISIPIVLWFYSTLFKKQLLIGNIVVGLLTALTAYLVVSVEFTAIVRTSGRAIVESAACSAAWSYATAYALFALVSNLAREIIKDMEDVKGDAACGCRTLPIEMGIAYSKAIVVALLAVLLVMVWGAFGLSQRLQETAGIVWYLVVGISLPLVANSFLVLRAQTSRDFHRASTMCKIVMLMGVLLMLFLHFVSKS